ncbi:unnamed protein product, partial [Urochloa humidicola]
LLSPRNPAASLYFSIAPRPLHACFLSFPRGPPRLGFCPPPPPQSTSPSPSPLHSPPPTRPSAFGRAQRKAGAGRRHAAAIAVHVSGARRAQPGPATPRSSTGRRRRRPWLSPARCEAPPLFLRRHRERLRMRQPTGTSPPLLTKVHRPWSHSPSSTPGPPHYPGLRLPLPHLRSASISPAAAFHSLLLASEAESSAARSPVVSGDRLPQSPRASPVGC